MKCLQAVAKLFLICKKTDSYGFSSVIYSIGDKSVLKSTFTFANAQSTSSDSRRGFKWKRNNMNKSLGIKVAQFALKLYAENNKY